MGININRSNLFPYSLPELDDSAWGYIAGIIDGEGYVGIIPIHNKTAVEVKIVIAQNDIRLLEYLQTSLGAGRIRDKKLTHVKKPVYDITISRRIAVYKILNKVYPYLIVKRNAADKIISYMKETYRL